MAAESATVDEDAAILELTDMVEEERAVEEMEAAESVAAAPEPAAPVAEPALDAIISDTSTQAARQSLSQLSSLLVRPQEGDANTLEGLVREMLRPMLKDWLEAKLPELVESLVKKEIDRIALSHGFPHVHRQPAHMGDERRPVRAMIDDEDIAIVAERPGESHAAVGGGDDRSAGGGRDGEAARTHAAVGDFAEACDNLPHHGKTISRQAAVLRYRRRRG